MARQFSDKYIYFLQTLFEYLSKVELDPISIEIQIMRLFRDKQLIKFEQVYDYIDRLSIETKMLNFNIDKGVIIISPSKLSTLMKHIEIKLKELSISSKKIDSETNHLVSLLSEKYENAPKGYQMTMVHLFGIENAEKLVGKDLKLISIRATGLSSLYIEINKGMRLSKYVKLIIND
jgi:5-methylcytosine-specific restriction protein B